MKKQTLWTFIWMGILMGSLPTRAVTEDIQAPRYPVSQRKGKDDYLKVDNLFGSEVEAKKVWEQVYAMVKYSPGISTHVNWQPGKKRKAEATREKGEIDEYLYFPSDQSNKKPHSFYLEKPGSERLDIQSWNVGEGNQYVQIQLQIGTGQRPENCLASINARKGVFHAPQHIMHCLLESYKTRAQGKNPVTINTDDPRFDRNSKKVKQ